MEGMFDVFDNDAQPSGDSSRPKKSKKDKKEKKDRKEKKSKKRHASGTVKNEVVSTPASSPDKDVEIAEGDGEVEEVDSAEQVQQKDSKRRRREQQEAQPVVTDTFEAENSRELAGAAGLQAKDEGTLVLRHTINHQVSLPPGYDYVPLSEHVPPEHPAKVYAFELDPFQRLAVSSIERGESVLVSAHTSAGKTVVAEYAIAQSLKNNQRVIYTSPIKALSNQKYREFNEEFHDVGLMTGDVTINPTASCLVMTTEILRSMLYRGSEIMREVQWVIFDEIHYMRDKTRGVVWEETIILLPDKVRYVFLSATIPNSMQFAEWITKTHQQPCHIVYTDFRPTPLQQYFFPKGSNGITLIVDEKGNFREDNFQKAMAQIEEKNGSDPADFGAKMKGAKGHMKKTNTGGNKDGGTDIYKVVKMIMTKGFNPVIVFSFSKRECEENALQMSTMAFNNESEKAMVSTIFANAIASLSEEDQGLQQIQHILPLLRRGIGVHHSGLLPILKETIEIMFQEHLIKVLFATETFSIGLNMPAKTVVFTSVQKFDGTTMRYLTPSEFIQMSGRAGRRGLDDRGIVIMMIDGKMEPATAREIVRGQQDNLNSAFYLGYNMILNLMRVEGISPEFMLERCFYQFQNTAGISGLEQELVDLQTERDDIEIPDESNIKDYYDLRQKLEELGKDVKAVITHPNYCLQFMQPGRLVRVKYKDYDFGWGVVVTYTKRAISPKSSEEFSPQQSYMLDVVLKVSEQSFVGTKTATDLPLGVYPPRAGEKGKMEVVPLFLSCIDAIGHVRVFLPNGLQDVNQREQVRTALTHVDKKFPDGIALLDPIDNMNIEDDSFKKLLRKIEVLEARLLSNPLHNSPRLTELYDLYAKKAETTRKIKEKKASISSALSIMQLDELKSRQRVLRRLQFVSSDDIVQMKARVACEISSTGDGHELILAELLFNRFFNEMSPETCAAVLSCFIFEEKSKTVPVLSEQLKKHFTDIQAQARIMAKVSQECKLKMNEDEYVQTFKMEMMETVFAWSQGKSFADICKMTDIYEGSLIRIFRRLEELLRQMAQAAKVMGSDELSGKFEEALLKIRRDIVASQSLYL